ncbi:hypothetical protein ACP70R_009418 [Stipagrostis hirtigluma subsp. patula]
MDPPTSSCDKSDPTTLSRSPSRSQASPATRAQVMAATGCAAGSGGKETSTLPSTPDVGKKALPIVSPLSELVGSVVVTGKEAASSCVHMRSPPAQIRRINDGSQVATLPPCSPEVETIKDLLKPMPVPSVMDKIIAGETHEVCMPIKDIFLNVMNKIGAPVPEIHTTHPSPTVYICNIEFTIPQTYSKFPGVAYGSACSIPCETERLAEDCAARNAITILDTCNDIVIKDFSNKMSGEYNAKRQQIEVIIDGIESGLECLIVQWEACITSAQQWCRETSELISEAPHAKRNVYTEAINAVGRINEKSIASIELIRCQLSKLQSTKDSRLVREPDSVTHETEEAVPKREIWLTEKDVLRFLLHYVGIKQPPLYMSELTDDNRFIGEVRMVLPTVSRIGCGGNTKKRGRAYASAVEAEQFVAWSVIRYIEKQMKLTVFDLNYTQRVESKNRLGLAKELL